VMKKAEDLRAALEKEKTFRTVLVMTKSVFWMPPVWELTRAASFTLTNGNVSYLIFCEPENNFGALFLLWSLPSLLRPLSWLRSLRSKDPSYLVP
jgi:hypothetical protein